jgi:hypothetical protein
VAKDPSSQTQGYQEQAITVRQWTFCDSGLKIGGPKSEIKFFQSHFTLSSLTWTILGAVLNHTPGASNPSCVPVLRSKLGNIGVRIHISQQPILRSFSLHILTLFFLPRIPVSETIQPLSRIILVQRIDLLAQEHSHDFILFSHSQDFSLLSILPNSFLSPPM